MTPKPPAKPFDPTLKTIVETEPGSWPPFLGRRPGPTTVIDADIATVTGAADKVLRVDATPPYLMHLEFVSSHDAAQLPSKLVVRNSLLHDRHGLPVRTAVVVLRPEADSPRLTGRYVCGSAEDDGPYLDFRYQVMRVWKLAPEPLLTGSATLLPLAPISAVTEAELPSIIRQMERRLSSRRERRLASTLFGAAFILLGLRYSGDLAARLFQGVVSMKESATYQMILEEGQGRGAIAEAKKVLRLQGDAAFGRATPRIAKTIERLDDLTQLEELLLRMRTAESWPELLESLPQDRGGGRRSPA